MGRSNLVPVISTLSLSGMILFIRSGGGVCGPEAPQASKGHGQYEREFLNPGTCKQHADGKTLQ
jgi:hypothetical protein